MSYVGLIGILALLAILKYIAGTMKASSIVKESGGVLLHSRPGYHGSFAAIMAVFPAFLVASFWSIAQPTFLAQEVAADLQTNMAEFDEVKAKFLTSEIVRLSGELDKLTEEDIDDIRTGARDITAVFLNRKVAVSSGLEPFMLDTAKEYQAKQQVGYFMRLGVTLAVAFLGFFFAYGKISQPFRSRNYVETFIRGLLIFCSTVAILTTVAIVISMGFESLRFFASVAPLDFFTGTVWDPRFSSPGRFDGADANTGQFGLIPLLYGTLYISLIAILVAGPIGLFAAIFLSEYAGPKFRAFAKPALEVLAGIPTIVYGFFAIVTIGPILFSIGEAIGFDIQTNSVLTAGLVMGMMIIPFISSLSDDIINSVPQTLRDGSLALGSTPSETIKKVVLPAALPGIVGAFLLATSRAIGETMIVVMAAGVAANIALNPGEPMTTITVKIVSQLTGDTEFTSPQTLVAFALSITLFAITLVLNVIALQIVRHYREQYD